MTNTAKRRNNVEKKARPKSWCVASSRADPGMAVRSRGVSKLILFDDHSEDGISTMRNKYTAQKNSTNASNVMHYDSNNNFSNENICHSGKQPKVIRRTNVDKVSRRAVVSLNLSKDYNSYVEQPCPILHPKKNRPKSLYQNFFRRSCTLIKSHVFGNNTKYEPLGTSCKSNQRNLQTFSESREILNDNMAQEYCSILTDGETCIFSNLHSPLSDENITQWKLWTSNEDIPEGVSLETGELIPEVVGNINPTEAYLTNLMPWAKRSQSMPDQEVLPIEPFQCRRDNRKYASLRSPSKSKGSTPPKCSPGSDRSSTYRQEQFMSFKRHSNENLRFNRSGSARYHRPNSMDSTALRRKTINYSTSDPLIDDNLKNMNPKIWRNRKAEGRNAPNFFIRYQDILREENINAPAPISSCDSPKFTQINEVFEYLLNLHCTKPVTKTCKQLFYIRSRLSKNARRNDSMCDGCFGCDKENISVYS